MKLTTGEQNLLAQRIAKQFDQWITEEMQYQIEDMKDMDELVLGILLQHRRPRSSTTARAIVYARKASVSVPVNRLTVH